MLEYTSRQVTQLIRQYEMFSKSINILTNESDKEKIVAQMTRIKEKILEETNSIYEEEYNLLLESNTYLVSEEKEKLLCLIKLVEDRIKYVKENRKAHKEVTGQNIDYFSVLGEDKLADFRRHIKIIDKFNENKKKENQLGLEINELDEKISEAVKKIKNNKNLNTTLEKKMINFLTKVFDKLELYSLAEKKYEIESEFKELEFSLTKAKENVKKAKKSGNEEIIIECDSLLSSITLEYERIKEKKYTIRLMEMYDNIISDYEQLLAKREEINEILSEISSSQLYSVIGEELNKQFNTIKIEKQDIKTYETLVEEREKKYNDLEAIGEENSSEEFREVLEQLLVNEKKRQEELIQEQRKKEYEERQRKLIEDKKLEDERRKRQRLIIEERKKEQESRTRQLLEQQRKTVIVPKEEDKKSFNSVLEKDSIPIIKNNNLTPEKVGIDSAIKLKEEIIEKDLFPKKEEIFPTLNEKE